MTYKILYKKLFAIGIQFYPVPHPEIPFSFSSLFLPTAKTSHSTIYKVVCVENITASSADKLSNDVWKYIKKNGIAIVIDDLHKSSVKKFKVEKLTLKEVA